ncbi:MAG TPA: HAD family hydrolase [Symbiobacteriaceae bacterium]|nr:HAD family hydrolase [Symbiobacteriaceae bacterium]
MRHVAEATWLFFDVGEVLMDERPTNRAWAEAVRRVLAEDGLAVSVEQALQAQRAAAAGGYSDPKNGAVALLAGDDETLFRRVRAHGWPLLDEPFADAVSALEWLKEAGYRLGLIANQRKAESRARLGWSGLLEHFEVVLLSGDVGLSKPDPAIFQLALQMAECAPGEAVMVGDRPDNDIAPARQVGMGTVRILRGLHRDYSPRSAAEEADVTVDSLGALTELLRAGRHLR